MTNVEFDAVEGYDDREKGIIACFKTERFGYVQIKVRRTDQKYYGDVTHSWKFEPLPDEPNLNMFTDRDTLKMECMGRIAWRLIYDAPAAKERFE